MEKKKRNSLAKLANDAKADCSIKSPEKIMKGEISNYSNLLSLNLSMNEQSMKPLNKCKINGKSIEDTNSQQKTNKEINFEENETLAEQRMKMYVFIEYWQVIYDSRYDINYGFKDTREINDF